MAHGTRYTEEQLENLAARYAESSPEPERSQVVETERGDRTAVLSLRLPVAVLATLKSAAEAEDIGATVLARELIIAGLAERGRLPRASVSVADLMSFALMEADHSTRQTSSPTRSAAKKPPGRRADDKNATATVPGTPVRKPAGKRVPGKTAKKSTGRAT